MNPPPLTFGLPRMHKEAGERRDFLPPFVSRLAKLGVGICLEEGYGSGMGIDPDQYLGKTSAIRFGTHQECYQQDFVLVLRYPGDEELDWLRPGTCLISMIHFPTRPGRIAFLKKRGLEAVSLESICDDQGKRLVENLHAVGWNGVETAFNVLSERVDLDDPTRLPIRVTLLGAGMVGSHAIQAAIRYGNIERWRRLAGNGVPGVVVTAVDYDVTCQEAFMLEILARTDILIDATQRPDPSVVIIPNPWIAGMPEHAVLLDLSVDPYECNDSFPSVKGIEGVPQGSLDQYVFYPDDPAFDVLPDCVNHTHRRTSVSNYSWPGVHPENCMLIYGNQILPLIRNLVRAGGTSGINPQGRYFQRALARGLLSMWDPARSKKG
jgi:alanine dehydrogenase